MANINGNNIDDLFRQASDQYPLRTDGADWGKVAHALEGGAFVASPSPLAQKEDKRKRKQLLWLLLLLPLSGIGYYAWHAHPPSLQAGTQKIQQTGPGIGQTQAGTAQTETGAAQTEISSAQTRNTTEKTAVQSAQSLHSPQAEETTDPNNLSTAKAVPPQKSTEDGNQKDPENAPAATHGKNTFGRPSLPATQASITSAEGSHSRAGSVAHSGEQQAAITMKETGTVTKTGSTPVNTSIYAGQQTLAAIPQDPRFSRVDAQRAITSPDRSPLEVSVHSLAKQTNPETRPSTPLKIAARNRHSFYIGILGAPDLSTVQFQAIKSVGSTFGVLVGYTLSSKWSLETGVYVDHKKYATDGQYFNTKNVSFLWYDSLLNVNGYCNMLEIPINLRYNLSSGKNFKWFTTAGLSTYLMSRESYAFQYLNSGSGTAWDNMATYTKPYHYVLSIVNMSLGYEQRLGRIGNLRVEPYLRIPLSGIGTGSLSIMSAGLNMGITRTIR